MQKSIGWGAGGSNGRRTECVKNAPLADAVQPSVDISRTKLEMRERLNFPSGIIRMEAREVETSLQGDNN